MPLLTDFGAYLVATTSLGLSYSSSTGYRLFLTPFPDQAQDAAVCMIEYGGGEAVRAFGNPRSAPVYERPRVQLTVRDGSSNFATARAKAEDIYQAVDATFSTTIGSALYLKMVALQPPFHLGSADDDNSRHRFVFNVEVWKERG